MYLFQTRVFLFLKCCSTGVDAIKTTSPRMEEGLADRTSLAPQQQQQLVQPERLLLLRRSCWGENYRGIPGKSSTFGKLPSGWAPTDGARRWRVLPEFVGGVEQRVYAVKEGSFLKLSWGRVLRLRMSVWDKEVWGYSRRSGEGHTHLFLRLFVCFLKVTQVIVVSSKRVVLTWWCLWIPVFYPVEEASVCGHGGRLTCAAGPAAVSRCRRPLNDDPETLDSGGIGNKFVAGVKWDLFSDINERVFWFARRAAWMSRHLTEPFKFPLSWKKRLMEEESSAVGCLKLTTNYWTSLEIVEYHFACFPLL